MSSQAGSAELSSIKLAPPPSSSNNEEDDDEEEVESERKQVEDYLKLHELEDVLNSLVNELVVDRPVDPYLSLSSTVVDFSKTTKKILDVRAQEVSGPAGMYLKVEVETARGVFSSIYGGFGYDEDPSRHYGKGYMKVINSLNALLGQKLKGMDPTNQAEVDRILSEEAGLADVAKTAVSIAVCKAGAKETKQEVFQHIASLANNYTTCTPVPSITLLEGGRSASNKLVAQGVMVLPYGATSVEEAMDMVSQIQRRVEAAFKAKNELFYGRMGGLAPPLETFDAALNAVKEAIAAVGLTTKVGYALDVNAFDFSEVVKRGSDDDAVYNLSAWDPVASPPQIKKCPDLIDLYTELLVNHPFISVSEPFHPLHKNQYAKLAENFKQFIQGAKGDIVDSFKPHFDGIGGDKDCTMQLVGDRPLKKESDIDEANTKKTMNAIQIDFRKAVTVSGFISLVQKAQGVGMGVVVATDWENLSDSYENMVAHMAVGLRAGQVKFGGFRNADQLNMYQELLRIERLGGVPYAGNMYRSFR